MKYEANRLRYSILKATGIVVEVYDADHIRQAAGIIRTLVLLLRLSPGQYHENGGPALSHVTAGLLKATCDKYNLYTYMHTTEKDSHIYVSDSPLDDDNFKDGVCCTDNGI